MNDDDGKEMVNDYLKLVRRHLPEDIADEIITELGSYIVEEAEEHSDSGVSLEGAKKAISRLGAPSEVAAEYVESMYPGKSVEKPKGRIILPNWIIAFVVVITFFIPVFIAGPVLISVTWSWGPPGSYMDGLQFLTPQAIIFGLASGFFNIIFGIQVVRYLRYRTPWWNVVSFGLLTFALPIYMFFATLLIMSAGSASVSFLIPIPIQFILGMLLVYSRENKILGWTAKESTIEVPVQ